MLGLRSVSVPDVSQGATIPTWVAYPTDAAPHPVAFGPYTLDAATDAPIAGERLPIVLVSHGTGGTAWAYRGLTAALVGAGFAVVLVQHPGNTRGDDGLANTPANLANRPRHLRLALDAVLDALGDHVSPNAVIVGHSMGAYTALAVAGGRPTTLPTESATGVAEAVDVTADPRIRGVALLAPAIPWFLVPGTLDGVTAPVLVRIGERDPLAPAALVDRALANLPANTPVDRAIVPGGGHFFPFFPVPAMLAQLPPGQDSPGFDRKAYQPTLHADLVAFVRRVLR